MHKAVVITILVTTLVVFLITWFSAKKYFQHKEKYTSKSLAVRSKSPSKNFQWCYNPGYPWSIPRISLPDGLGLLLQYQMEWWFYVGYLLDDKGVYYTLEFTVIRSGVDSPLLQVVNTGVKVGNDRIFKSSDSYGFGASNLPGQSLYVPTVGDKQYRVNFKPQIGQDKFNASFKSGIVGVPGAKYNINSKGSDYSFNFDIIDMFGGRMEGINGYIGGAGGANQTNSSYEYCFPWHSVLPGGKIDFDGVSSEITEGWMWLDRQVITYADGQGPLDNMRNLKALSRGIAKSYTLYTGNWVACVLPDTNTSFYVACGWPTIEQKGQQWQVGSDLQRSAVWSIGAIWSSPGSDPQGINIGGNFPKFSLNVYDAQNLQFSPHWKSPKSGNVYCNAWKLTFSEKFDGLPSNTLYLIYLRPDCETVPITGSAFMEGAARVFTDPHGKNQVGWSWVEQMGQN
jgi:hypothetical protein